MVQALLFDLTDTLQCFDWKKQWKLFSAVFARRICPIEPDVLQKTYQQVYESYRLGWFPNDLTFMTLLTRQLGLRVSSEQLVGLCKEHLEIRKEFTWLPEGYKETLQLLRKHFTLGVASSAVSSWTYYDFSELFGFDFREDFDTIQFSQEQGHLKESGILFERALKQLGVLAPQAAFIGNSYTGDVLTAKRAGLKSVFLNLKNEPAGESDVVIKKLSDLQNVALLQHL